jgi:hypothetical protein
MDPGTLAAILTIGTIVVSAATGLAGHLLGRRSASGRVGTSEAAVLWQQAQDMRTMLLAEKQKAEEQRDKFIESYSQQIVPALATLSALIEGLSRSVAEAVALNRANSEYLREVGARGPVAAQEDGR